MESILTLKITKINTKQKKEINVEYNKTAFANNFPYFFLWPVSAAFCRYSLQKIERMKLAIALVFVFLVVHVTSIPSGLSLDYLLKNGLPPAGKQSVLIKFNYNCKFNF